ncbi:MAG: hypothetical protein Q7S82_02575, partial [bacterium]|nr:hypothetical protein [bacterium]
MKFLYLSVILKIVIGDEVYLFQSLPSSSNSFGFAELVSMRNLIKNIVIVLLLFLVISGVFTLFSEPFQKENNLSLTQLVSEINQEKIKK